MNPLRNTIHANHGNVLHRLNKVDRAALERKISDERRGTLPPDAADDRHRGCRTKHGAVDEFLAHINPSKVVQAMPDLRHHQHGARLVGCIVQLPIHLQ